MIDDKAYNVPLVYPVDGEPYVDWNVVGLGVMVMLRKHLESDG